MLLVWEGWLYREAPAGAVEPVGPGEVAATRFGPLSPSIRLSVRLYLSGEGLAVLGLGGCGGAMKEVAEEKLERPRESRLPASTGGRNSVGDEGWDVVCSVETGRAGVTPYARELPEANWGVEVKAYGATGPVAEVPL